MSRRFSFRPCRIIRATRQTLLHLERLEERTFLAGDINLVGNGNAIVNGDTTPRTADNTDFGSVTAFGAVSVSKSFTVQNTGADPLNLTGAPTIAISGSAAADFTVTAFPSTPVAGAGSTTFTVTFDPSTTGTRAATITILSDDPDESPYSFAIRGTGSGPDIVVLGGTTLIADGDSTPSTADLTDFGGTALEGGTIVRTFTIGNAIPFTTLNLTGSPDRVTISGANASDFVVSVQPAASVTSPLSPTSFQITFDPSGPGLRTAVVSIPNNDPDENPFDFAIQGIGGFPDLDVAVGEVSIADGDVTSLPGDVTDFGIADLSGDSFTKTFTIRNTGDNFLNLGSPPAVTITPFSPLPGVELPGAGDFTVILLPELSTIGPGGSTTFEITYNPSPLPAGGINTSPLNPDLSSPNYNSVGSTDLFRFATVNIASDDTDENPYNFVVSGTAIVGTVEATLAGGVLTVSDIHKTGRNNGFVLSVVGEDLVVSDALSLETFTVASAANTGGTLSLVNKVLTIPLAGITTVIVNGNGGSDTFNLGLLLGLTAVTLNGGDGDDTFGSNTLGNGLDNIIPFPTTRITINGGGASPAPGGDRLFLDLSTVPSLPAIWLGTAPTTQITTLRALPYQPFAYSQVEIVALRDGNEPTNFAAGDFYARGGDLIPDRLEMRPNATVNTAKFYYTGLNIGTFLVPGKVLFYGRGGGDTLVSTYNGHAAELYGEDGNDWLSGANAADKAVGGAGNDNINAGEGHNVVWGDKDPVEVGLSDTDANRELLANDVAGAASAFHATGTFVDTIRTGGGNDVIYCGPGNDGSLGLITSGGGNDYVHGGEGNDQLDLGAGHDRGYGGPGNDTLYGRDGNDFLGGGDGNDICFGGNGHDIISGGAGNDLLFGDAGTDRVYQGSLTVTVTTPPLVGTDQSKRKDDLADQAILALLNDWADNQILGNVSVATDAAFSVG